MMPELSDPFTKIVTVLDGHLLMTDDNCSCGNWSYKETQTFNEHLAHAIVNALEHIPENEDKKPT